MRVDGGVREVVIGVPDLAEAAAHWREWGYRVDRPGALDADAAHRLYGVGASLQALRLRHGTACCGLIRLWQWSPPARTASGLGLAAMRSIGSRWSVHRTDDITAALGWARHLSQSMPTVSVTGPVVHSHGRGIASINLAIFTPLYRHVVLVRRGIDVPRYGTPDPLSLLGTSEACHVGLVLPDSMRAATRFYSALGLCLVSERRVSFDPESVATQMFPLRPGEALTEMDFDDPSAGPGAGQLPGRLRVFLLQSSSAEACLSPALNALGYVAYTLRLQGNAAALRDSGAAVDGQGADEFGDDAVSFRAPDGQRWLARLC